MFFEIASSDDAKQPDAKDKLRDAFAVPRGPAEIEVYPSPARMVHPSYAVARWRADLR